MEPAAAIHHLCAACVSVCVWVCVWLCTCSCLCIPCLAHVTANVLALSDPLQKASLSPAGLLRRAWHVAGHMMYKTCSEMECSKILWIIDHALCLRACPFFQSVMEVEAMEETQQVSLFVLVGCAVSGLHCSVYTSSSFTASDWWNLRVADDGSVAPLSFAQTVQMVCVSCVWCLLVIIKAVSRGRVFFFFLGAFKGHNSPSNQPLPLYMEMLGLFQKASRVI